MSFLVCMEWSFFPKDYFEEEMNINIEGYKLKIPKDGIIKLDIPFENKIDDIADDVFKLRDSLTEQLNALFLGIQSITGEAYKLEQSRLYELHANGSRYELVSGILKTEMIVKSSMDFIIEDQNNCVIQDTKRERIAKKKKIVDLTSFFHKDSCLQFILDSYERSLKEPYNKLSHLYDIRDAIKRKFNKSEKKMIDCLSQFQLYALGGECIYDVDDECIYKKLNQCSDGDCRSKLKKKRVKRLGEITNNNVKQGRHRGDHFFAFENATESELEKMESELEEADEIARSLIEAYMKYLGNYNK